MNILQATSARSFIALTVMLLLLLLPITASANSLPPLPTIWFKFVYETSPSVMLEGFQFVGCEDETCEQPILLSQYARCDAAGCLTDSFDHNAKCRNNVCGFAFEYWTRDSFTHYKLIAQFTDAVRESELLMDGYFFGMRTEAQVLVRDNDLVLSNTAFLPDYSNFGIFWMFTIFVEVLAGMLIMKFWLRWAPRQLLPGAGYIVLANLLSYPVTWIFWPSLGRLQPEYYRAIGCLLLLLLIFLALLLISGEYSGELSFTLLFTIMLVFAILEIIRLFIQYFTLYRWVLLSGFPPWLTITLSELFAVGFEMVLLYGLVRRAQSLSLRDAFGISLFANASSFLLGLVLLQSWLARF